MTKQQPKHSKDEGYLLLGLVVVCFILLLFLSVAAPTVAKELERDRELESEHRAQEYVRAIQLYYRRTQRFPTSVEQLLGSGTAGTSTIANVKYLRQQYKDPLTHDEYRLILVGQAKTEVKGFFGEPLQGAPTGSLGSVAGMQSNPGGQGAAAIGGSTPGTAAGSSSGFSLGGAANGAAGVGNSSSQPGTAGSSTGSIFGSVSNPGSSFGSGTSATTFQGSKGAFLGVGSSAKGHGLVEWNGSENIEDWEFLYDPRVELLKAKVSLFGGSPAASGNGSLGNLQNSGSSLFGATSSSGSNGASGTQSGFGFGSTFAPNQGSATSGTTTNPAAATPTR